MNETQAAPKKKLSFFKIYLYGFMIITILTVFMYTLYPQSKDIQASKVMAAPGNIAYDPFAKTTEHYALTEQQMQQWKPALDKAQNEAIVQSLIPDIQAIEEKKQNILAEKMQAQAQPDAQNDKPLPDLTPKPIEYNKPAPSPLNPVTADSYTFEMSHTNTARQDTPAADEQRHYKGRHSKRLNMSNVELAMDAIAFLSEDYKDVSGHVLGYDFHEENRQLRAQARLRTDPNKSAQTFSVPYLIKAGEQLPCRMVMGIQSKVTKKIVAECVEGPIDQAQITGTIKQMDKILIARFDTLLIGEQVPIAIDAVAIHHGYEGLPVQVKDKPFIKKALLAGAIFLKHWQRGLLASSRIETTANRTIIDRTALANDATKIALAGVGEELADDAYKYAKSKPVLIAKPDQAFSLLFLSPVRAQKITRVKN